MKTTIDLLFMLPFIGLVGWGIIKLSKEEEFRSAMLGLLIAVGIFGSLGLFGFGLFSLISH